jgi:transcriptional regulator with XRE-family HTH domain
VRRWRDARGLSQLRLALAAGVSARHLSFVESGRAEPGRDVLIRIGRALELPLREQNQLLQAGGYAPLHPPGGWATPTSRSPRTRSASCWNGTSPTAPSWSTSAGT